MIWKGFEQQFGIDLGTSNTLIYQKGKGITLKEPSVLAIRKDTGEIEAVGEQARAMIGRTPSHLEVIYPLKDGVIANYDRTTAMLQHFFQKISGGKRRFHRSRVVISIPCGITNVQKRAVEETTLHAGAKKAITIETPLAAALGAGLPVEEPVGSMVLDIGGGTTEVAILSLGGIVVSHSIRRGGMSIDQAIIEYIKYKYNLTIGERTAEELKKNVGSAVLEKEEKVEVRGRDLVHGLPRGIFITSQEIYGILEDFVTAIVELIRLTIEKCPPELAGDVMEHGIMLSGGGALLSGLDRRLRQETKIPVHLADQPLECVALGVGKLLQSQHEPTWNRSSEKLSSSAISEDIEQKAELINP
jgi:rod shape-determining protein MreB